jgi:hypothetical protein
MKLSSLTVNPTAIEQGDWVGDIPDCGDLRLKVRGIGNDDYRRMYQAKFVALTREQRKPANLAAAQEAIMAECLSATCLIGIENLEGEGGTPVTMEDAQTMLLDPKYGPLRSAVFYAANLISQNAVGEQDAAAKN